jgi:Tol biopolymer transport system component
MHNTNQKLFSLLTLALIAALAPHAMAAGNYCGTIDRILFTSNRDSPGPVGSYATYNLFSMDSKGGQLVQLTHDAFPVINQHPVFTTDCQQVVWVHGDFGGSSIWIMNKDGSSPKQVSSPPPGTSDAHPWTGADGNIYFTRFGHSHGTHTHSIWRMSLNGGSQAELVGGPGAQRFHPNLRNDNNLVLYTVIPAGRSDPLEIHVYDQQTKKDVAFYKPGWPVSAAIWHPDGNSFVVAEDPKRNGRYEISLIAYPSGTRTKTLTSNSQENLIPYYEYPSGAAIVWVQRPIGPKSRNIARMNADGTDQTLLTKDGFENTIIVGEVDTSAAPPTLGRGGKLPNKVCKLIKVGCLPVPPPWCTPIPPGRGGNNPGN